MYKCSIIIYGDAINFVTCYQAAYEMLCTQNDFFYNDNFKICEYNKDYRYTLLYINKEGPSTLTKNKGSVFVYSDLWEKISGTKQLLSIIHQIINLEREEKNRFLLHASAVSTPEGAYVFVGNAGAGKTSILLRLCSNPRIKMISNDKVVIGLHNNELYVERGSRYLNLRKSSIDLFNPSMSKFFDTKTINSYTAKKVVLAETIGIRFVEKTTKLNKVFFTHILKDWIGPPEYYTIPRLINGKYKWSDVSMIYETFSQTIRGTNQISVYNGNRINENFYMPLLDTSKSSYNRKHFISKLINEELIVSASGKIEDIEQYVISSKLEIPADRDMYSEISGTRIPK